jgi:hypothetical protein
MQTNQGSKFDQNNAHDGLQISPRSKFDRMTIVKTGIEVIKAQTGNK